MRKFTADPQALFRYRGLPPVGLTVSMALQHLVSMIVGCVTPAIIIAHAAALTHHEQVLLIQASLVLSAVTTLLQLFPIGGRFGSGLPVIFGVSFAYLPSMQAIATGRGGMAAVAGAMLVGGVIATLVGLFIKPIRRLFPPVITGTVVFTIGLSLYRTGSCSPGGRLQTILPVGNHTPPRRQIFVCSLLKVYTWSIENASKILGENLRIICYFYKKDFTKSKMCSIISGKERGCMCEPGK